MPSRPLCGQGRAIKSPGGVLPNQPPRPFFRGRQWCGVGGRTVKALAGRRQLSRPPSAGRTDSCGRR